ncbi:hypothetical protein THIX_20044 [Thiomonas sp. X19]|nr:hypothetical protein THIX_20044 [Thiomonas sp. X19]
MPKPKPAHQAGASRRRTPFESPFVELQFPWLFMPLRKASRQGDIITLQVTRNHGWLWESMAMHQSGFLAKDAQTAMPIRGQIGMAVRQASQGNAGPPQVSLTPTGGWPASRPWGRSKPPPRWLGNTPAGQATLQALVVCGSPVM